MDVNLNADLDNMETEDLLAYQQELTRARLDVLDAARRVQKVIDYRAAEIAERRRREDSMLGRVSKPPTQQAFGEALTISADDVEEISLGEGDR